jgi:hypothetical protein
MKLCLEVGGYSSGVSSWGTCYMKLTKFIEGVRRDSVLNVDEIGFFRFR